MTDTPTPTPTDEEQAELVEQTDNGPRPEDGDQPVHVPAHGVVDGVQTDPDAVAADLDEADDDEYPDTEEVAP